MRFGIYATPTFLRHSVQQWALFLACAVVIGCGNSTLVAQKGSIPFSIKGTIEHATVDSIRLFEIVGGDYVPLAAVPLYKNHGKGNFEMQGKVPAVGVYMLAARIEENKINGIELVLGEDKKIEINANESNMAESAKIIGSEINNEYQAFIERTQNYQAEIQTARQDYAHHAKVNPDLAAATKKRIDSLFAAQSSYHQQVAQTNKGLIGKVAKLYYYSPYGVDAEKTKAYADEQAYFKAEFLKTIDFNDPQIGYLPIYYQKLVAFAMTLMGQYGADFTEVEKNSAPYLQKMIKGSRTEEVFLLAFMNAAAQMTRYNQEYIDVYLNFADIYIKDFPKSERTPTFAADLEKLGKVRLGQVAPEIALETPAGKELKLSSLKGKYVLVDFWASWCGPCRRENPHVVGLYDRFASKGFEVYSVSLDKDPQRWKEAIDKDGLKWKSHVSDLQGWASSAAKLYGVSSIPSTFLLDKDGRIIAKNLRGQQLEQKLAQLLGEDKK